MYKLGDILICWRLEDDSIENFISIDKIISTSHECFKSKYYICTIFNKNFKWGESFLSIYDYKHCKLEDYKKYKELRIYDKIIKELKKEFFKEYKIDGRKIKLNKLWNK